MWTRIGGKYSGVLAWIALIAFVAPWIALSIVSRSLWPGAIGVGFIAVWVATAVAVLVPVMLLKLIAVARSRRKGRLP